MDIVPDLRAFEIATAVIAEGSMSLAAKRLNLTQSAVSQAVKRAESQIGAVLIHRETRPMIPTEAGRVLVARMRELFLQAARVTEEARPAASPPEMLDLRLGMIDSFAATAGPFLLRELMDGAMALRLTALSGLAAAHSEALLRRAIDAVVTSDPMEDIDGLQRFPLYREPFVLVVPAGLKDSVAQQTLEDLLSRHRLIRYSARSHMGTQVERHLRRLGLHPPPTLSLDTSDALLAMVASGMGIAITTPLCLLQGATHRTELDVLPLPSVGFSRVVTLITRRGEVATLEPRIATATRTQIRSHILPRIANQIPWLAGAVGTMVLEPSE